MKKLKKFVEYLVFWGAFGAIVAGSVAVGRAPEPPPWEAA